MEHGVAAAEAHLGMDVVRPAELVELVEHAHGLGKVHAGATAAVVAVAAVQVADLGQVPLQGKGGHPALVRVGRLTLKKTRLPHQGGSGREQEPPGGGGDEDIVEAADRDPGLAGRVPTVDPLLDHFQGEQVVAARGAADHRRRRCRPVEEHQRLARLRGQGAVTEEFGQPGPAGLEQAHTRVDGILADRGRDVDRLRGQPVAGQLQRGEFRQKGAFPTAGWMSSEVSGKIVRRQGGGKVCGQPVADGKDGGQGCVHDQVPSGKKRNAGKPALASLRDGVGRTARLRVNRLSRSWPVSWPAQDRAWVHPCICRWLDPFPCIPRCSRHRPCCRLSRCPRQASAPRWRSRRQVWQRLSRCPRRARRAR